MVQERPKRQLHAIRSVRCRKPAGNVQPTLLQFMAASDLQLTCMSNIAASLIILRGCLNRQNGVLVKDSF